MINATVISASCSALKLAPHIEERLGITGKAFMDIIMNQLAEMGVPDAHKMESQKFAFAGATRGESVSPNGATGITGEIFRA